MHLGQRNCQSVCLKTLLINKIISNRYPPVNLYIDVEKPPILDLFPRKTHGYLWLSVAWGILGSSWTSFWGDYPLPPKLNLDKWGAKRREPMSLVCGSRIIGDRPKWTLNGCGDGDIWKPQGTKDACHVGVNIRFLFRKLNGLRRKEKT